MNMLTGNPVISQSRTYVMMLQSPRTGFQFIPFHLPDHYENNPAIVANLFQKDYLEKTSIDQAGLLTAAIPIEQFKIKGTVPVADLCRETLLDIQGLLERGFVTNIKEVLDDDPMASISETILALAQTRASYLGIESQQVLDDVYPTQAETESEDDL